MFHVLRTLDRCKLYLSGQLPFDSSGSIPGTDIYTQTTQCLSNIQRVLADCNLEIKDVFKVTVWLKNVEDFGAFNKAYSEYFSSNIPARSVVRSELMIPNALVEIEVIASS